MHVSANDLRSHIKMKPRGTLAETLPPAFVKPGARLEAKRARIVDAAMRQFAEHGYHAARMEDLAAQLGMAKGSIFQYFGSKAGLFLEAYKKAVRAFPAYLDCPVPVREKGFFEILRYWLMRTEHLVHEDWVPYRVSLLGNYGVDLGLKREINRFLLAEDPYGSAAFVQLGIARGEVRSDIDPALIVSILDWTMERFQDALLTEELDPGLFPHPADPKKNEMRIQQFLLVLRGAIGV
ncbi:MAG TPA: helix-turn-helix domain-containing protein [Candidatus Limnocylindrales bacterium]|nr:helix-turn-helix domain-containing protein [Candidatus Limnocylindrales bacterium]